MLSTPSRQRVGVGFGLRNMIGDTVASGVAHANHMEGDAHGHIVGVTWNFDIATGVKSGFELSRLDAFSLVLAIQGSIVVLVANNGTRGGLSGGGRRRD